MGNQFLGIFSLMEIKNGHYVGKLFGGLALLYFVPLVYLEGQHKFLRM